MAATSSQQNFWNLQLSTIINNSKQGILLVDRHRTVSLCNSISLEYLNTAKENIIGKKIDFYFSKTDVQQMYASKNTNRIFCNLKKRTLIITSIPIISRQEIENLLLYIEDIGEIQKTERAIRRETWIHKGFIAKYTFEKYSSANMDFQNFISLAKSFAKTDEPIVILGETGSGKEVLAQSIHNYSSRTGKAFVAVNCAAISDSLLESELFGYNEGAFTGALKGGKEGYFEMAHQGTIFLDELGEMSPALQSKLLRVIQEKQVLRVGGTKLIPFDTRIIVATNKNLWDLVQNNSFRKDLYYRLNVLELEIPSLRNRKEDIILLFLEFLKELSPAAWNLISLISGELEKYLTEYSWPGNIRELKNFVHTLVASIKPDDPPLRLMMLIADNLKRKHLSIKPASFIGHPNSGSETSNTMFTSPPSQPATAADDWPVPAQPPSANSAPPKDDVFPLSFTDIKSFTNKQILETLIACNGNIPKAARLLGIHRTTLWRKMQRNDKMKPL